MSIVYVVLLVLFLIHFVLIQFPLFIWLTVIFFLQFSIINLHSFRASSLQDFCVSGAKCCAPTLFALHPCRISALRAQNVAPLHYSRFILAGFLRFGRKMLRPYIIRASSLQDFCASGAKCCAPTLFAHHPCRISALRAQNVAPLHYSNRSAILSFALLDLGLTFCSSTSGSIGFFVITFHFTFR